MGKDRLNDQDLEKTKAYLATLSHEELCEFMIAKSQDLLDELDQVAEKVEQMNSTPLPLLAVTRKEVENILGEEYFETLWTLRTEGEHSRH